MYDIVLNISNTYIILNANLVTELWEIPVLPIRDRIPNCGKILNYL